MVGFCHGGNMLGNHDDDDDDDGDDDDGGGDRDGFDQKQPQCKV